MALSYQHNESSSVLRRWSTQEPADTSMAAPLRKRSQEQRGLSGTGPTAGGWNNPPRKRSSEQRASRIYRSFESAAPVAAIPEEDPAITLAPPTDKISSLGHWWQMTAVLQLTAVQEGCLLFLTWFQLEVITAELGVSLATAGGLCGLQAALVQLAALLAGQPTVSSWGPRLVGLLGLGYSFLGLMAAGLMPDLAALAFGQSLLCGAGLGFMAAAIQITLANNPSMAHRMEQWGGLAGVVIILPGLGLIQQAWGRRVALQAAAGLCLLAAPAALGLSRPKRSAALLWQETEWEAEHYTGARWSIKSHPPPAFDDIITHRDPPAYLLVMLANLLAVSGLSILTLYLLPVARLVGLPPLYCLLLLVCLGLGSQGGHLLAGWLGGQPWCRPHHLTRAALSSAAAIPFFLASVQSSHLFGLLSLGTGLVAGILQATNSPFTGLASMAGRRPSSDLFAALLNAAAVVVGPPLGGMVVAVQGSLPASLYLANGLLTGASLAYSLALLVSLRQHKFNQYEAI